MKKDVRKGVFLLFLALLAALVVTPGASATEAVTISNLWIGTSSEITAAGNLGTWGKQAAR